MSVVIVATAMPLECGESFERDRDEFACRGRQGQTTLLRHGECVV